MRRFLAFAVCGLSLVACTSGDLFKLDSSQVTLQLESEPPGADARVSTGATCKTPCAVPITTTTGDLTVTYTLEGYQPQEAAVQVVQSPDPRESPTRAVPNPVRVELVAVPRPPARRRPPRRAAPKQPAAQKPAPKRPATAAPPPAPQQQPAATPPPPSSPEPAASQTAPWPAPSQSAPAPAQNSPWPTPPPAQQ